MSDDANDTPGDDDVTSDAPAAVDEAADEPARDDEAPRGADDGAESRRAKKAKADAVVAERTVTRRTVTSRRVTPRGGSKAPAPSAASKARDAKKTESVVTRSPVPPSQQVYAKGPSPWWVPAIMFGLLILGALVIMANYMIGDQASNTRLVIGLGLILGGIITATQYR